MSAHNAKIVALLVLMSACGTSGGQQVGIKADAPTTPGAPASHSTDGDPRDLISLTNVGVAQTFVVFETYEQLRDYSDVATIGTVERIEITKPYVEPWVVPGEMEVTVLVDAVLGGRFTDVSSGDRIVVRFPMHAPDDVLSEVVPRLAKLEGTARYAMFLQQVDDAPRRFEPIFHGAPSPVLAEWPDDGRLTDMVPHDYLARDAIRRGEEKTGTSAPPPPEWQPAFETSSTSDLRPPIGMTVAEAAERFAGRAGEPTVEPPAGWERYEKLLAPSG